MNNLTETTVKTETETTNNEGEKIMENTANSTFVIPNHRMGEFVDRLEKLNKKAVKTGCEKITFVVTEKITKVFTEHPFTGQVLIEPMVVEYSRIELTGHEPKFSGWTFLARIDHDISGNIINSIPGIELNERYRTSGNICEHCKIDRYRKQSFVVKHETGIEKQVGSSCLRDFLGHGSPEKIASYCSDLFAFFGEVNSREFLLGGHYDERYFVNRILEVTSALIRNIGFVSSAKSRETGEVPTVSYVFDYMTGKEKIDMELRRDNPVTEQDTVNGQLALSWLYEQKPTSDYIHNLQTLCKGENATIDRKHVAIVVSLLAVWYKNTTEKIEYAKREPSQWIEKTGRITLENVKVLGVSVFDGSYGLTYIYRFLANDRDKLTWFSSNNLHLDKDDIIKKLTFSIKKLDVYKDEKITVITRGKIIE